MENYEQYGLEAELAVVNYINSYIGLMVEHNDPNRKLKALTQTEINKSALKENEDNYFYNQYIYNMRTVRARYGDAILPYFDNKLKMNVVRGTWISHNAINHYRGHLYCIIPNGDITNISQARIIPERTLTNFYKTCLKNNRKVELINGKSGFRYNKMQAFITLEEFVMHYIKLVIMHVPYGTKEFYKELKAPFMKKLDEYLESKK